MIIESISSKVASVIKNANPEQTASFEVMKYALDVLINLFAVVFLTLLVGWITESLFETALTLISFIGLRMTSGGYHLKSLDLCVVASIALLSILPHIPVPDPMLWFLNIISFILVIWLAPTNLKDTRYTDRAKPVMKFFASAIVLSNFFVFSPQLALSFFSQSILLLPKGGENDEETHG